MTVSLAAIRDLARGVWEWARFILWELPRAKP